MLETPGTGKIHMCLDEFLSTFFLAGTDLVDAEGLPQEGEETLLVGELDIVSSWRTCPAGLLGKT